MPEITVVKQERPWERGSVSFTVRPQPLSFPSTCTGSVLRLSPPSKEVSPCGLQPDGQPKRFRLPPAPAPPLVCTWRGRPTRQVSSEESSVGRASAAWRHVWECVHTFSLLPEHQRLRGERRTAVAAPAPSSPLPAWTSCKQETPGRTGPLHPDSERSCVHLDGTSHQ